MPQGFKSNRKGMRELRKSAEVLAELERRGKKVERHLGPGYELDVAALRNRGRAGVGPTTTSERIRVAKNPAILSRAREAARD